ILDHSGRWLRRERRVRRGTGPDRGRERVRGAARIHLRARDDRRDVWRSARHALSNLRAAARRLPDLGRDGRGPRGPQGPYFSGEAMNKQPDTRDIQKLLKIMAQLRAPSGGCPWDLEQTFATIAPYTIEEAYEVADAIERGALDDLRGELGDLLFQVVFHAR